MIVAAQSALQGALVCALSGTAGIGALRKELHVAWLDWFDHRQGPPPDERLASFLTLLKWGTNEKRIRYGGGGAPLKLTKAQMRDIKRLHGYFRNSFMHFAPKGWAIEVAGLPRMVLATIEATEFLMLNQPRVRMHLSGNQARFIETTATRARIAFG